ncbi:hypothetical protein [Bacillus siamensis]|uniref:hypothetical protein n=1 Tax=Bacillus siamensis TaxID=659243 RepID=UPI002230B8FA|nr:hypothetical protein [Bacillus siamensis]UZD72298.1 hypothetical protein OM992_10665 [Bacillus siamensis]
MKRIEQPKINDIKTLKENISNFTVELERGDTVQIIDIGERGYDLRHVDSGEVLRECGWDLFV